MGAMQPWHIILVVVVFLVLFGSKKLPDAARGLGRSMRIFKSEVSEMQNDDKSAGHTQSTTIAELGPGPNPLCTNDVRDESEESRANDSIMGNIRRTEPRP